MASLAEIQALVEQIKNDLPLLINRSQIAPKQIVIVNGLSDMSERLGLLQAGEFRSGNGKEPGFLFSGVRIGYPAFAYAGDTYNFVGVQNDVLQVGISADDGKLYFGAGTGVLNSSGIELQASGLLINSNGYKFVDAANTDNIMGGVYAIVRHSPNNDLYVELRAQPEDGSLATVYASVDSVASTTSIARLTTDSGANAGVASEFNLLQDGTNGRIYFTNVSAFDAQAAFVFNETGANINQRMEGDTNPNLFYLDAGNDRIGIGTSTPASLLFVGSGTTPSALAGLNVNLNGNTYISASNGTKTIIMGADDSSSNVILGAFSNHGLDFRTNNAAVMTIDTSGQVAIGGASESGFKLKVIGNEKITGDLTVDGLAQVNGNRLVGLSANMNLRMRTITVANNAVAQLLDVASAYTMCMIFATDASAATYFTRSGVHDTQEINDWAAVYSVTAGTASSTNIYWSAGNSRYELENKRGLTLTYYIYYFSDT